MVAANSGAIENFIKKYRLAQNTKSKDFRLTIEEAGDLIAGIALLNNQSELLKELLEKTEEILKESKKVKVEVPRSDGIDGGSFKG
jgi:predicted DNA-binding transcriptional regulator YafY